MDADIDAASANVRQAEAALQEAPESNSEDEEDEEDEQMRSSDLTPQAKQARPRMTEGAGLKPKFVGDRSLDTVIGGDAGTIDAW